MGDKLPLNTKIRFGAMAAAVDPEQARKTVTTLSSWGYGRSGAAITSRSLARLAMRSRSLLISRR